MATAQTRGKTRLEMGAGSGVLGNSAPASFSRAVNGLNSVVGGGHRRPASVSVSRGEPSQSQSQSPAASLTLAPAASLAVARKRGASAALPLQNLLAKRPRVATNTTVCNQQNANAAYTANASNTRNTKHATNPPPPPSKARTALIQSLVKQPVQPQKQLPTVSRTDFKSFVFYLDASSKPPSLEAAIKELGAVGYFLTTSLSVTHFSTQKTHFTFQRGVMTHYIVGESELNFVRDPTASLASAASSSLKKRVEFATTWGCAVWSCSRNNDIRFKINFVSFLMLPAKKQNTTKIELRAIITKLKKPIKNPTLATLIDDDKYKAHHPNAPAALHPNAPLPPGYILLRGRYVLVEDAGQKHRPMHCKEWEDGEDGEGEDAWPYLHLEGKADGRFRGNAFIPAYSDEEEGEEEEDEDTGQGEEAGLSTMQKAGICGDDEDGSGMEESAGVNEEVRSVLNKQRAAIEEEKGKGEEFGGQEVVEAMSDHQLDDDDSYLEPTPTNASGLNNTTSMRPQLERLKPSGKVAGLMAREIGVKAIQEKSAAGAATTAMAGVAATEGRKATVQDASRVPSAARKDPVVRRRKRTGPKGKDFYNRSGYCENCAEKYDHFIKHVHSTRHLAWADDTYNFHTIDVFIATTERPLQSLMRSPVKNPFSPRSSNKQVPSPSETINAAMRTPAPKRHQNLLPSVYPGTAGKCTPIAHVKFKNSLAAATTATPAPMAGSTRKSVFLSSSSASKRPQLAAGGAMLCVHEKDLGRFERTFGDMFDAFDGGAACEEGGRDEEDACVGAKSVGERRRTRLLSEIVDRVTLYDGEVVLHQGGIPVGTGDTGGDPAVGTLKVEVFRAAGPDPAVTDENVPASATVSADSACGDNLKQVDFLGDSVAPEGRVKKKAASAFMKRPLLARAAKQ
ncbi:hypothetical protein BC830DRAFT_1133591 [Chytriomyces sp. MP71]|nr:hypothetical protein BC830DRAFT_1133591 [Chytriomyces sp. MP71]